MIRISAKERRARGRAADTAPSPPTRTKSSISEVTNKTHKNSCPLPIPFAAMQERVQMSRTFPSPPTRHVGSVKTFLLSRRPLGSAHQQERTIIVPTRPRLQYDCCLLFCV